MEEKRKVAKSGAQRAKEYRERHPEKSKQSQKEWYEKNKEKIFAEKARMKKLQELFDGFTDEELEKARQFIVQERQTV